VVIASPLARTVLALTAGAMPGVGWSDTPSAEAGAPGGPGLAIRCAKALTMDEERPVVDRALILIADGRFVAIGPAGELEVPAGYELLDVGARWAMPGMVDLHCHVAGTFDINGAVYQANPGLRVRASVVPDNPALRRAVAAGVTTVLYIPGSATTMGGQGVLLKTAPASYEAMRVRDPAALKLAQADNPKAWGWGMGRLVLNWQIRDTLRRGLAYARRWERFERDGGAAPELLPQYEIFRELLAGRARIAAHTQAYQVVYSTLRIVRAELGLPVFIDHGTFDGFLAAEMATALEVPAILGPRSVSSQNKGRGIDHDGRILGVAAEYQQRGHPQIGFNTDAPVIPQEELALQAAMGVRYGFDDARMQTVRGLTIVPARVAGVDERIGSLEPGKDADLVILSGHPSDPRNAVERVYVEGRLVYDAREGRKL
jgi:imidazolonepropionase-like amidohydrolase